MRVVDVTETLVTTRDYSVSNAELPRRQDSVCSARQLMSKEYALQPATEANAESDIVERFTSTVLCYVTHLN